MKIMSRAALAAAVAVGAIVPASANHSWGNYHWARSGTLSLKVNTAVTSAWASYVDVAINTDWDGRSVLELTAQPASASLAKKCSPMTGQLLVCNAAYGQRGWLGIATIWTDTQQHITAATTKLNDSYYGSTSRYNTPAWRRLVACQEIGHDFGLAHQNEIFTNVNTGSCMDYTNAPAGGVLNGFNYGPSNEHPNAHDTEQLNSIYNHSDSYSTNTASTNFGIRQVGKPVPEALPSPGDSPAEWGSPIHHDEHGRPDQFVRRLSSGGRMITHVLWAPE